jgi:putative phosphoserine phosphatase/1-acylglycerol-3-phosphate O-acyltransferase
VGPFKKGAFRIAMATGLPVVPIVIRNSDSVAGRNATTLHPGTVDIAVLPPVSVADWTVANLGDKIEQIRGDYQELLADWPATLDGRYEAAARVSQARHAGAAAMPGPRNEERARGPAAAPGGPAKPAGSGGPAKPAGSGGPAKPAAAGGQARSAATGGQANTAPPSGAPEANGKTP